MVYTGLSQLGHHHAHAQRTPGCALSPLQRRAAVCHVASLQPTKALSPRRRVTSPMCNSATPVLPNRLLLHEQRRYSILRITYLRSAMRSITSSNSRSNRCVRSRSGRVSRRNRPRALPAPYQKSHPLDNPFRPTPTEELRLNPNNSNPTRHPTIVLLSLTDHPTAYPRRNHSQRLYRLRPHISFKKYAARKPVVTATRRLSPPSTTPHQTNRRDSGASNCNPVAEQLPPPSHRRLPVCRFSSLNYYPLSGMPDLSGNPDL